MFPYFSIYSSPLFILYVWGFLISVGLFWRYYRKKNISDLLLGLIIAIHTFERTTYTVGFMGWYDSFPNTKINYFLVSTKLMLGPLIYFYVRSITLPKFKVDKWVWLHFVPQVVYILYRLIIFTYDVNQAGFDEVQNGKLFEAVAMTYGGLIVDILSDLSIVIYFLLSIQMYVKYRKQIENVSSNMSKMQLNWVRNFLLIFIFLFIVMLILNEIDSKILDLDYKDYWWGHLAAALALIYFGVYGFILNVNKLHQSQVSSGLVDIQESLPMEGGESEKGDFAKTITAFVENNKSYLDAELTLGSLSKQLGYKPSELSKMINSSLGVNFNDFINRYRVEAIKESIASGKADQYTLLTIAYSCGFNSKATFNRTFKKFVGKTPSEYLRAL